MESGRSATPQPCFRTALLPADPFKPILVRAWVEVKRIGAERGLVRAFGGNSTRLRAKQRLPPGSASGRTQTTHTARPALRYARTPCGRGGPAAPAASCWRLGPHCGVRSDRRRDRPTSCAADQTSPEALGRSAGCNSPKWASPHTYWPAQRTGTRRTGARSSWLTLAVNSFLAFGPRSGGQGTNPLSSIGPP